MATTLLYGLQRSGTNFLEQLLATNYEGLSWGNDNRFRSLPLHKHFRPYREKVFIPTRKYLHGFDYEDFHQFELHLQSLIHASANLQYLVIAKDPLAWYGSVCAFAHKNRWESYQHKALNHHLMLDYDRFYGFWLRAARGTDRVRLIRYEDLLAEPASLLDPIAADWDWKRRSTTWSQPSKVPMSKKFSPRKFRYYRSKAYQQQLSSSDRWTLAQHLSREVSDGLGYPSPA